MAQHQGAQKEGLEFNKSQYEEIAEYCADRELNGLPQLGTHLVNNFLGSLTVSSIKLHRQW